MAQVDPPHPFKSALKTLVIAAIVVSIAMGLYVYLAQKPPVASGEVLASTVYPVHASINNGTGANDGMAGSSESIDQVIILTKIKIRNQTDIPLFVQDIGSAIKLPDGTEQTNVAASDSDVDRVFQAYPSLSYCARIHSIATSRYLQASRPRGWPSSTIPLPRSSGIRCRRPKWWSSSCTRRIWKSPSLAERAKKPQHLRGQNRILGQSLCSRTEMTWMAR